MPKKKTAIIVLTFLIFLIGLNITLSKTIAEEKQRIGFGVSDYETDEILEQGTWNKFAVARIYNTGNVNMTVEVFWVPNDVESANGLNVTLPKPIFLAVEESKKVFIEVFAKESGNFSGRVEFTSFAVMQGSGNPTRAGGSARVSLNVLGSPIEEEEQERPTTNYTHLIIYVIMTVITIALVLWMLVYKLRRRKK